MASVTLKNVEKIYGQGVYAVKDVSLEIADKEFVVIVGPSGCGKTSVLRMIAGLEEISRGEIFIGEKKVNDLRPRDRDIAMVFQNYALYPHMSVYDNMAFGLKMRKIQKGEIKKRVHDAARLLGIEELLLRKPKELSGGQRQRVAMGRAIVREPKVFLMDEPLSNLDAQFRVQMRAELKKLHQRLEITTIYVTHDQVEAMTLGSRIVVIKEGVVQQVDAPMNLYERPANRFVAGFIGSPSMNFFDAQVVVKGDGVHLLAPWVSFKVSGEKEKALKPYADRQIVAGIRPENLRPAAGSEENCAEARVELVEPAGSEVHLYLTVGDSVELVARALPDTRAFAGEKVRIALDAEKLYAFEKETGKAI